MANKNHSNREIHSEDLKELLNNPPSWLLKGGLFLILSTMLIIFGVTSFIRYPEIVRVPIEFDNNQGNYYGTVLLPQDVSLKVKKQQEVLIKVRSYPHQEYGYLKGKVDYISDIPIKDSLFFSKVTLLRTDQDSVIKLKPGIMADAEIITEDQSIFKRIWLNLTKSLKF